MVELNSVYLHASVLQAGEGQAQAKFEGVFDGVANYVQRR
jgi:hypothetical protein